MKKTLGKLWDEYFSDECAAIDTDEERELAQKTLILHKEVIELLDEKQASAMEKYVDAVCDLDSLFVRKAFFKGCEFAVSFLLEAKG